MHRIKGIVLAAGTFISFVSTAGAMPLAPLDHGQSGFVVQVVNRKFAAIPGLRDFNFHIGENGCLYHLGIMRTNTQPGVNRVGHDDLGASRHLLIAIRRTNIHGELVAPAFQAHVGGHLIIRPDLLGEGAGGRPELERGEAIAV